MSSPRTLLIQYRYDPLDRLVMCAPANLPSHQRFYQKDRLATEIHGVIAHSIFQQEDRLLAQQQRQSATTTNTTLLATDQQRSVLHTLNQTQRQAIAYNLYGHRAPTNGLLRLLGFNGERADPVTGHYLLGNGYRAFNPVLMRFNSPDSWSPFGRGGMNSYSYCQGDPVNQSDPTGHIVSLLTMVRKITRLITDSKAPQINRLVARTVKAAPPPLVVTGGMAASSNNRSSLVSDVLSLTRESLFGRTGTPKAGPSPGREIIQRGLNEISPSGKTFGAFSQRLEKVNGNLITHGNNDLSPSHGEFYVKLAGQVETGKISNTTAHLKSAEKWMETQGASRIVGTTFNLAAAMFSGADDHIVRKVGAVRIRRT